MWSVTNFGWVVFAAGDIVLIIHALVNILKAFLDEALPDIIKEALFLVFPPLEWLAGLVIVAAIFFSVVRWLNEEAAAAWKANRFVGLARFALLLPLGALGLILIIVIPVSAFLVVQHSIMVFIAAPSGFPGVFLAGLASLGVLTAPLSLPRSADKTDKFVRLLLTPVWILSILSTPACALSLFILILYGPPPYR
jgi:hypothetical protein